MGRRRKPRSKKQFRKTVFSNGLTLVTEQHPEYRSLSVGVWVKAGTRHERPRETGISHFLEHMLFKGTETRSALDIVREVDRVGGEFNAFTSREYTCFHILVLDRDVGLAADVLSDVLLNSTFDAGEFETERKVIQQEIAITEENPEELATDLFFERLYGRHGLGRQILGYDASVRRLRRADLLRYYRKHYVPEQIIISVSGSVSHEALVRRFRPLLGQGRWPGRPKKHQSRRKLGLVQAPRVRSGLWWERRPSEQSHVIWGVETAKYTSRDRFICLLLNCYLGVGMSSLLFQEIREKKGLAYSVYSSLSSFIDSGVLSVYAGTHPAQIFNCIKLIEECVAQVCKTSLTEDELASVRDNLKGSLLLGADNVEARMSSIAKNEIIFGRYYSIDEVCDLIDEVTPQDIRRVARKIFGHGKRSVLILGPKPPRSVVKKVKDWAGD